MEGRKYKGYDPDSKVPDSLVVPSFYERESGKTNPIPILLSSELERVRICSDLRSLSSPSFAHHDVVLPLYFYPATPYPP